MNFSSDWKSINSSKEDVFAFLSNLQNLGTLMPDQVVNWKADTDQCSFTIQGMTDLNLIVSERTAFETIRLIPTGKSPFPFRLSSFIREQDAVCEVNILIEADLNPMLAMMAKRPLQNLVAIMAQKLAEKFI